jgi:fumarylpyruvate hydrolase
MHGATSNYVIQPTAIPALPVQGTDKLFPVHRVYCVGRNYAAHAVEMGHDPNKEPPFFFQKNPDNLDTSGEFPYPPASNDVHHEIEMVVALKSGGTDIPVEKALDCVYGYGVGLDMTRRDLQGKAKDMGRPWEVGKAFESSAPCSALVPAAVTGHPKEGAIWLDLNGERRQTGDLNQMIWKVPEMISYLSGLFTLAAGDIILSGTPSGVGAVKRGDVLEGHVDGIGGLKVRGPVKSAGVVVGRVTDIRFDNESYEAIVAMTIDAAYQFPRDTTAKILTSGILGEQYVGLEAGGDGVMLKHGDRVRLTQSAVVLENLISQFLFNRAAEGKEEKK